MTEEPLTYYRGGGLGLSVVLLFEPSVVLLSGPSVVLVFGPSVVLVLGRSVVDRAPSFFFSLSPGR